MKFRVLFFSVLRDITGCEEIEWQTSGPDTVAELLNQLRLRWPKLADWDRSLLIAINHSYVGREATLCEGCEVAIMPPVQGG